MAKIRGQKTDLIDYFGGVAERLNAPVLKTGKGSRPSEVRILSPPPTCATMNRGLRLAGQPSAR